MPAGAHPRSRGEHSQATAKAGLGKGSSPLARGTLAGVCRRDHVEGLIPARAGNTASLTGANIGSGAHPRSRGEHLLRLAIRSLNMGSSPLARGTHNALLTKTAELGLIPARAGNTSPVRRFSSLSWAHPRSRGEHVSVGGVHVVSEGSSPLARGARGLR